MHFGSCRLVELTMSLIEVEFAERREGDFFR